MMDMSGLPVKWYDGVQAVPRTLTLDLRAENVTLEGSAGSVQNLEWESFRETDAPPGMLRFQGPALREGAPPGVLEVERAAWDRALAELPEAEADRLKRRLRLRRRKTRTSTWILIAGMVIPLCWVVYTGLAVAAHRLVPVETEIGLGVAVRKKFTMWQSPVENPERVARLERWVEILRPEHSPYPYEITLLEIPQMNAAAAPGGQIIVFTGLLEAMDDAEVMAILAHEIAHVELRHGLKSLLRSVGVLAFMSGAVGGGFETLEGLETAAELSGVLVLLSYSRKMELEADAWAVKRLRELKLDADGLRRSLERLHREQNGTERPWGSLLSTHPATPERIERLRELNP